MSAPVPNASYAPNGYERVSPGHYRRREDDPEARAAEEAIAALNEPPHLSDLRGLFKGLPKPEPFFGEPSVTEANRLNEIATLIRLLTYGEMMDLAAAVWKMRPEGKEVTEQELPGMFHRWSAAHE